MINKYKWADHDEWLEIRHKYIGGSDAGSVIGLNKYCSPYRLWLEKTDKVPSFQGDTITEVGSYLEEFVAQQFTKQTGLQVRKSNFTYVNDKYPWACANVDRLIVGESDALLEVKTTGNYEYMDMIRRGEPVPTWWAQITHYMTVLEKKRAYLAVLLDCREVKVLQFDFNSAESISLMEAEREFWDMVQTNNPPEIDGSDSTTEGIRTYYGQSDGSTVDLTPVASALDMRSKIKAQIDWLKNMLQEQENIITSYMGAAETGTYGKYKVSWKNGTRKSVDYKAYEASHAGCFSEYTTINSTRTFRVTEKKER